MVIVDPPRFVPKGRVGRILRLASAGARVGAHRLRGQETAGAEVALEALGNLRGLATKVGQMLSYVDGVLPPSHRDSYGAAMSALFRSAPPSPPEAIRDVVERELGGPIQELFSRFSSEPMASASIGQVHRATLLDGTEVAVKVQHPGIRQALESDLANAGLLETLVGSYMGKGVNAAGVLQEARERFLEELDYELEASRQLRFAEIHAHDPLIHVPRVFLERSSRRVLTTELARGMTLDEASTAEESSRRAWAETMWRFVFRGSLVGGLFNADPHPGNFFFAEGGNVWFIDYGCVQPFPVIQHAHALQAHMAAIERNEAMFWEAGAKMLDVQPGQHADMAVGFMRQCFEPLFASPFRMSSMYVTGLVRQLRESALHARHLAGEQINPLPKGVLFLNRLQFGFYSVLARLDATVDYAGVERPILVEAQQQGLLPGL